MHPQAPRLEVSPATWKLIQPFLPQCWQPGTSGLLMCGPVFLGQSDLPPGDQKLIKACKHKINSPAAVTGLNSASLEWSGWLCRANCLIQVWIPKKKLHRVIPSSTWATAACSHTTNILYSRDHMPYQQASFTWKQLHAKASTAAILQTNHSDRYYKNLDSYGISYWFFPR